MSPRKRGLVSMGAMIGVLHIVWLTSTCTQRSAGLFRRRIRRCRVPESTTCADAPVLGGGQVTGDALWAVSAGGLRYPIRYPAGRRPGSPYDGILPSPATAGEGRGEGALNSGPSPVLSHHPLPLSWEGI